LPCVVSGQTSPRSHLAIPARPCSVPVYAFTPVDSGARDPFTSEIKYNAVSKITVPLKTFTDLATLNFTLNGSTDPTTDDNLDEVTFNYARKTTYVSRACGYKTTFTLNAINPVVVTPDSNNWIQNVIVSQPNIENENETHVKIYF
jgi:hypothetical protein